MHCRPSRRRVERVYTHRNVEPPKSRPSEDGARTPPSTFLFLVFNLSNSKVRTTPLGPESVGFGELNSWRREGRSGAPLESGGATWRSYASSRIGCQHAFFIFSIFFRNRRGLRASLPAKNRVPQGFEPHLGPKVTGRRPQAANRNGHGLCAGPVADRPAWWLRRLPGAPEPRMGPRCRQREPTGRRA